MDVFREDGHLTDQALTALIREEPEALVRLEMSEHMAFCDRCLQRYTDLLEDAELLVPEHSCQPAIWRRIRSRTLRMMTSRYATAAAAVGLALTVVWGSGSFLPSLPKLPERPIEERYAVSQSLYRWGESLDGAMRNLNELLDGAARQGGGNS